MKDDLCVLKNSKVEILDVPKLAKLMGRCEMSIYRYLKSKNPIPAHKVEGKYVFFKDEVLQWLRNK